MLSSLSCPGTLVRPRPSCTQAPHRRQRRFIPARALLLGEAADAGALAAAGSLLTAAAAGSPLAAIATPLAATGGPAAAAKLLVGGLAGAGLASLVPPPPPGLREPVSVDLEHTPVPLNTHGLKGGAQPPFQVGRGGVGRWVRGVGCLRVEGAGSVRTGGRKTPLLLVAGPHSGDPPSGRPRRGA